MINWPWIRRKSIIKALDNARKDERDLLSRKYEYKLSEQRRQLEMDKLLAVKEVESKLHSLESDIIEMRHQVQYATDLYYLAVHRTKSNKQLSIDMGAIAESMLNEASRIYSRMMEICTKAKENTAIMEKETSEYTGSRSKVAVKYKKRIMELLGNESFDSDED